MKPIDDLTRREFVGVSVVAATLSESLAQATPTEPTATVAYSLTINGQTHRFDLEPRVTLLDLLRERLQLTGSKKGCDHGQCGACTVMVDGHRVVSCLTLAVTQDGAKITTIEGLANGDSLHAMQAAFIERDGFQCGFCTSGQICSAVAMLEEWRAGMPSTVGPGGPAWPIDRRADSRTHGRNICRCGAYPNIVAAVRDVHQQRHRQGSEQ